MVIMRLSNAELHFGSHAILNGVDFVIEKGDIGSLCNGVGKTTLFHVLSGEHLVVAGSTLRSGSPDSSRNYPPRVRRVFSTG